MRFRKVIRKLISLEPVRREGGTRKRQQLWSIGIYLGTSPIDFFPPDNVDNPVLTQQDVSDVPALFVADPFMLKVNQTWCMFFEVMNRKTSKGEIGLAISENGANWRYQKVVLAEPFHLSYPCVFQVGDDYFMVPETFEANEVRLYKAVEFPTEWCFVRTLLYGREYVDPSIFFFEDKCWLFVGLGAPPFRADILRLYYADELMAPWIEHPRNPIVEGNVRMARPAGRMVVLDRRVVRYAQDCYPTYGSQVRAFEITELSVGDYREREVDQSPVLAGSQSGWNGSGMHHIDPHRMVHEDKWIACVDGWMRVWV